MTLYILVVAEGALEEICGVSDSKEFATNWAAGEIGGIAPKRFAKEFTLNRVDESAKEARWVGPFMRENEPW